MKIYKVKMVRIGMDRSVINYDVKHYDSKEKAGQWAKYLIQSNLELVDDTLLDPSDSPEDIFDKAGKDLFLKIHNFEEESRRVIYRISAKTIEVE